RIVPSPRPIGILEAAPITDLIEDGYLVVAAGGGGIPIVDDRNGHHRGIAAVIDKDHAAERIADAIDADALVLVTGVPSVKVDFGSPEERTILDMSADEARRHLADGQFPPGSMGPKIEAATNFAVRSGRMAVVTTADLVLDTLDLSRNRTTRARGTRITAD